MILTTANAYKITFIFMSYRKVWCFFLGPFVTLSLSLSLDCLSSFVHISWQKQTQILIEKLLIFAHQSKLNEDECETRNKEWDREKEKLTYYSLTNYGLRKTFVQMKL